MYGVNMNDCRECEAGLVQATQINIGWRCAEHGVEQLSVSQILLVVGELRDENQRLRAALARIADRSDAEMEQARTLHYDMRGWAKAAMALVEDIEAEANDEQSGVERTRRGGVS
jgi:hypothetical protein